MNARKIKRYYNLPDGSLMAIHIPRESFAIESETRFITSPEELLQMGIVIKSGGERVPLHTHLASHKSVTLDSFTEVWVVMHGSANVCLRGKDDPYLQFIRIESGDVFITFSGEHGILQLEKPEGLVLFEVKLGPYNPEDKVYNV